MALLRIHVSEERITPINKVKGISELVLMFLRSLLQLLVTANVIPSVLIFSP
jgi:hypothetical protein